MNWKIYLFKKYLILSLIVWFGGGVGLIAVIKVITIIILKSVIKNIENILLLELIFYLFINICIVYILISRKFLENKKKRIKYSIYILFIPTILIFSTNYVSSILYLEIISRSYFELYYLEDFFLHCYLILLSIIPNYSIFFILGIYLDYKYDYYDAE